MKRNLVVALFALLLGATSLAHAESPVQLALMDPIQLADRSEDIKGLRLDLIYGANQDVSGLDLGIGLGHTEQDFVGLGWHFIANRTDGDSKGVQWGLVNYTIGDFTGWQGSWVSITKSDFVGLQSGLVSYTAGDFKGWQHSYVTVTGNNFKGLQTGLVTWTEGNFKGLQLGAINYTEGHLRGLQLGIINRARIQKGLQIGLININDDKDPLFVFPFVNWKF